MTSTTAALLGHPHATMRRLLIRAHRACELGLTPPNDGDNARAQLAAAKRHLEQLAALFEHPGAYESRVILNPEQTCEMVARAFAKGFSRRTAR